MPVRNEEAYISHTLKQLLDQEQDNLDVEIIVVDGRSTDRTREIVQQLAREHSQIRLIDNPGRLSSSARNIGIENSRGDFLVVIDGHCEIPGRSYFIDLVAAFERTRADCLGRPQPLDVTDASRLQKAIGLARSSSIGHHPDSFIYSDREIQVPAISVAVAYRREVFDRVGMFDTQFDACEDCELNHRIDQAGMSCYLVPELAIRYQPRNSLTGLFRQLTRYGRGRFRLARKHSSSLSLTSILPALFLLGCVFGPVICYFVPVLWYAYFGVLLTYTATVLGFSVRAAISSGDCLSALWLPIVFVVIHLASGWGILTEAFSNLTASSRA